MLLAALLFVTGVLAGQTRADRFSEPEALCEALGAYGFKTSAWGAVSVAPGSPFVCQYPHVPHQPDVYGSMLPIERRAPRFVYRVWGRRAGRADSLSFAVTLIDGHEKAEAKRRFMEGVNALFEAVDAKPQAELLKAIDGESRFRSTVRWQPSIDFSVAIEERKQVFWLRVSPPVPQRRR
jgi:hypothetical protein